ncbi:MAG: GNAT family N-acetyltransferase [Deltaproteobacteria bacterium]|nr:GNAT family N-acetyltransferase [Deltaproteobacteria bacterium]MBP7288501.1 GNAT family N-acetyltransferase [Nannocystaceae bacterium]
MSGRPAKKSKRSVILRPLLPADLAGVQALHALCFPGMAPWSAEQFESQLRIFPEGQIGVEVDGQLVATSSSLLVDGRDYEGRHTFAQACDGGRIGNHNPDGDSLYGIDIAVHPEHQGLRLARRLYEARQRLVTSRNLRRMLIAGRIPGYAAHADRLDADAYVRSVLDKRLRDPVLTAQVANGFVLIRVLPEYLPSDRESRGHAVLMEWLNPNYAPAHSRATARERIRVCAVQYQMRTVADFDAFVKQCRFFVETASDYRADFVLFPELLTNQLLSLVPAERPGLAARRLSEFTQGYVDAFVDMAIRFNVNIVAGTHLNVVGDRLFNVAYLFRRDGSIAEQHKIHITPSESRWWGVSPGNRVEAIETDCGLVSILICYDVEFPELARVAAAKGAKVLFVPYNTDIRSAHIRVRSCALARCIENHVYCVTAGAVGNLPMVEGADIHYAQSAILTPSDIPFPCDGIAAEATPNAEVMLVHDLDMATLQRSFRTGSVRTWHDRRRDLYAVTFADDDGEREY